MIAPPLAIGIVGLLVVILVVVVIIALLGRGRF